MTRWCSDVGLQPGSTMISCRRHSNWTGESLMRGGRTKRDGSGSSPVAAISSSPRSTISAVRFICSRCAHVAMLYTNPPVASTFMTESLRGNALLRQNLLARALVVRNRSMLFASKREDRPVQGRFQLPHHDSRRGENLHLVLSQ